MIEAAALDSFVDLIAHSTIERADFFLLEYGNSH
jgi:hypothetical protein